MTRDKPRSTSSVLASGNSGSNRVVRHSNGWAVIHRAQRSHSYRISCVAGSGVCPIRTRSVASWLSARNGRHGTAGGPCSHSTSEPGSLNEILSSAGSTPQVSPSATSRRPADLCRPALTLLPVPGWHSTTTHRLGCPSNCPPIPPVSPAVKISWPNFSAFVPTPTAALGRMGQRRWRLPCWRGWRALARPYWQCTPHTSSPTGSRTVCCLWTCVASPPTRIPSHPNRPLTTCCAGLACLDRRSRRTKTARSACTAASWPTAGC